MARGHEDPSTDVIRRLPALEVASVEVRVVDGPDRDRHLRLEPGTTRIGTAPSCRLRLTDPTVSRMHCAIVVSPEGVRIVDSDSTNGTWLEGVDVLEARIVSDATVRIGQTTLRVSFGDRSLVTPLSPRDHFGPVIGASAAMRELYARLEKIAPTDATVLLQGETGTGKEVIARAIHEASKRARGPFVTVDCGAIAEELMESELFGHVRGAFSGAVGDRRGLFAEADGGTLFLDEIGELPTSMQPKLLRVLEAREVRPVGGNETKKLDVRVIAATHRPLARSVNEGLFREDLYYRLAVFEIAIPPLRARREDVALLAQHFFERVTGTNARIGEDILAALAARDWPGNVRELRNFVERSVCLGWTNARASTEGDSKRAVPVLEALVPTHLPLKDARAVWTGQFESLYVAAVLRRTGGNVTRAAEIAGVHRRYLHRLIAEHGVRDAPVDDDDDHEG